MLLPPPPPACQETNLDETLPPPPSPGFGESWNQLDEANFAPPSPLDFIQVRVK